MRLALLFAALVAAFAALWVPAAFAHNPVTSEGQDRLASGLTALAVIVFWLMYVVGTRQSPTRAWQRWLFHGTALITLFTILGPLDEWAEVSAAAHMTQHMFMMVVIAPLFALCKPLPQLFVAFGRHGRRFWGLAFKITRYPMLCAYLHGFMIWFWHIPVFYMLAVEDPWIHVFEHACFLITAVWFWWAVLYASARKAPFALLALLFTLMHTGFLGALLTFAGEPLYGEARHLQDQQLAGLIMWVLGGVPYIVGALWAGNRWYKHLNRRMLSG
ncbi:cytochrome c oxidase assembly protein [Pseudidiomarina sp. 1APP75-32.1]|uniref:Cytochrome c oxidase assembly protein n=1 Tax=Pseudidiomarina terrestris TaxID=2820060 RepID=A0AAW7R4N4_9GAMM|nr:MULTISPECIES: cytochrome c oxidase assembly protein [unclassified Pseudidiomarina]MDN7125494.1 cytochrome c oxidase assembly protein [Pseudidiomarina sp. 1APP75-32.1]MDN7130252.1 cytochrome c oxidase assembly protein [Pseudidiomarina sp. 1APR75-15]